MPAPEPVGDLDPVSLEESVMRLWSDEETFQQSIESRRGNTPFIFLEGPPTANGRPGIHHVVARTYKDLVCRWKAMEGHFVERKGGWDTHGLPVEIEVQKRLDLMSNEAIEEFGIAEFNEECRKSVWTYEEAWREMTERMAFWVDLDQPYVTLDNDFVESCWWALKQMFDKGLLYRGHKVLPYCPQTGTSYSSHEVALGYKEVEEPSVYVKFRLENSNASILAWTTTPWTLPGNVGLAVGPDVSYVKVRVLEEPSSWEGFGGALIGEELILAKDLMKEVLRHHVEIIEEFPGSELIGLSYAPLFPEAVDGGESSSAWTVLSADWVTTTDGTGVVHTAVMYGEDDYNLGMEVGLPAQHTVDMDGRFVKGTHPRLDSRYVKDCDEEIMEILSESNLLYREKSYSHDYPHCWRTDHPLLYYAMDSWFVRMTAVKDRLLEFNDQVEWAPDWVGEGRFGEWLRNVKDWAISRERYWGTPLPVWRSASGEMKCVGSISELQAEVDKARAAGIDNPECPDDVDLHRPIVDQFVLISETGEPMNREPFVMDCWFDSGCASFAQWHHPFDNPETFENNFPIDYICEGVDQTRGWFYTLLAVSTTVFDSLCYKRCLSLGLILDAEGKKMSKSRGNIVDPWDHFNREGADATRWYMVTAGAPWNPLKFDPNGVRETYGKMFLTLWNCYRFHADYAALDGFDPDDSTKSIPIEDRTPLDRWILSRLSNMSHSYHQQFEDWDFHKACRDLEEFVVNDLSNWYVRRSRRRLWDENESSDKRACQLTLHEVLTVLCRLMAPVAPYISDVIHRNLCSGESVHLADWPILSAESNVGEDILPPIDMMVEAKMEMVRTLAEAGRRIRIEAGRRQRLPCQSGWIVGGPDISEFHEILADELNVEILETEKDLDRFQRIELAPNRKALGKKCRQDLPSVLKELDSVDPESFLLEIEAGLGALSGYEIISEDIEIRRVEKEGFAASTVSIDGPEGPMDVSLVLDLALTENLLSKGLARDIIRRIQAKRKDLDLEVDTTISLEVWLPDNAPELSEEDGKHVSSEVRASSSKFHRLKTGFSAELDSSPVDVFSLDGEFDISFKITQS
ncbi:MAG: isoleucine--tRNA ligase [Candidatus Thalassarchaeaceae archaeon]|tara:strand:- start:6419 stop:9670 length:3252 start_codon:yes stop_codon:yes gene_type:complete